MKIRSFIAGYIAILAGCLMACVGICCYMDAMGYLPEALYVCGGCSGCITMMYAFFVGGRGYKRREEAFDMGNVVRESECGAHVGKRKKVNCNAVVCDRGIILDGRGDMFRLYDYTSIERTKDSPFEICFTSGKEKIRLMFRTKIGAAAFRDCLDGAMAH